VVGSFAFGNETSDSIKCGEFLTTRGPVGFSEKTLLHGVRVLKFN
jgi:hypothetical protein